MLLHNSTHTYQSNLANYCRTGKLVAIPGIQTDNVTHYRRLVYNVIDDMLENAYPLTAALVTAKEWKKMVNDFFTHHPCQSPQVWYMPKEFATYLIEQQHPLLEKYPLLTDLLWFEWTEVELFMMEDITTEYSITGDLLFSKLVLNPEHQLLSFNYPVHQKNARYISHADKGSYYAIAHRNKEGEIIFTDLSAALVRITEYLREEPLSVHELFNTFEKEFKVQLTETDHHSIIAFLTTSFQQELIIGFKK